MTTDRVDEILQQWRTERPDLDPSPIGIIGRLSRATRAIESRLAEVYDELGLSDGEFDVLVTLRRNGPPFRLSPGQLARETMLTSGGTTKRLDRLEAAGLIRRSPDPSDGRGRTVELTREGVALMDAGMPRHVANEERVLAGLSSSERDQLAALLRTLVISLE